MTFDYQFLDKQSFSIELSRMIYEREANMGQKKSYRITSKEAGPGFNFEYIPKRGTLTKDTYGFKLSIYAYRNFIMMGIQSGYFTDFSNERLVFIPEIGLGYKSLFIVYRRNMRVYGSGAENINKDNLSVRLVVPINQGWLRKK